MVIVVLTEVVAVEVKEAVIVVVAVAVIVLVADVLTQLSHKIGHCLLTATLMQRCAGRAAQLSGSCVRPLHFLLVAVEVAEVVAVLLIVVLTQLLHKI